MALPNRQVLLVATLFAVAGTMATVVVASSATVGQLLSGSERLATVPIALTLTGGVLGSFPASKAMATWGRRRGFLLFTLLGLGGALVAMWGLQSASFVAFCAGSMLIGAMVGSGQYFRFTAGEVAGPGQQEQALGYVLAAGVVGGILGPQSATWAADAFDVRYVGTFAVIALLAVLQVCLLAFLHGPPPRQAMAKATLKVDRPFLAAVLAGVLAFGAMVLTMYAAPLSLHGQGQGFATTARVLQAHVVAMFLPSFFTGTLVKRIGPGRGMAAGLACFGATVAIDLQGTAVANYYAGLVVLGLGWNLLFLSATTLLARSHAGADKASAQGVNEVVTGSAGAAAAFLAGPTFAAIGWENLNLLVAALLALGALGLTVLLATRSRSQAPAAKPIG